MKVSSNSPQYQSLSDPDSFRRFVIVHLNRIYCVQSHLAERLEELLDQPDFATLKSALSETIRTTERQLSGLYGIYLLMDGVPAMKGCDELTDLMESAYTTIYQPNAGPAIRDLSLLLYLQIAKGTETVSLRQLRLVAAQHGNKHLQALLTEKRYGNGVNHAVLLAIMKKHRWADGLFFNKYCGSVAI